MPIEEPVEKFERIWIVEDLGAGRLRQATLEIGQRIREPTRPLEYADELACLVRDRELSQSPGTPPDDHDDVAAVDVDEFAAHQSKPRVDHHVVFLIGGCEDLDMLEQPPGGRDTHHMPVRLSGSHNRGVRQAGAGACEEAAAALRHASSEQTSQLESRRILEFSGRPHDADPDLRPGPRVAPYGSY